MACCQSLVSQVLLSGPNSWKRLGLTQPEVRLLIVLSRDVMNHTPCSSNCVSSDFELSGSLWSTCLAGNKHLSDQSSHLASTHNVYQSLLCQYTSLAATLGWMPRCQWWIPSCHVHIERQKNVLSVFCCEAPLHKLVRIHIQNTKSLMCSFSYNTVHLGTWISLFKLAILTHEHAPVAFHKPYLLLEKSQFPHTLCFRIIRLRFGTCTWFWPRCAGCAGLLHTHGSTQRFIRNFCIPTQHQKQFHNRAYFWNKIHPEQLYSPTVSLNCNNLELNT